MAVLLLEISFAMAVAAPARCAGGRLSPQLCGSGKGKDLDLVLILPNASYVILTTVPVFLSSVCSSLSSIHLQAPPFASSNVLLSPALRNQAPEDILRVRNLSCSSKWWNHLPSVFVLPGDTNTTGKQGELSQGLPETYSNLFFIQFCRMWTKPSFLAIEWKTSQ